MSRGPAKKTRIQTINGNERIMGKFFDKDDPGARKVDGDNIKNKWNWQWLELKVTLKNKTFPLKHFFKKDEEKGKAKCVICDKYCNYGSRGSIALVDHCKSSTHVKKVDVMLQTQSVKTLLQPPLQEKPPSQEAEPVRSSVKLAVPIFDRKANAEAMILGVIAEHSLSLSVAPVIVDLAKALAEEKAALSQVQLIRTTATYKLVHGVAHTLSQRIYNMRNYPFSLNMDESTSNSNKKVLAILVSYLNLATKKIDVENLDSIELKKVNSASLYKVVVDFFTKNQIP
ncbi:uncharacterized protein LOC143255324 [Tachypleus tridentatus]|uniref:uncharacterized protein LOC143255324 n=1 Tax=Tachypleus tridentatus TaxID=6853 RepID=UPI003FCFFDF9